MTMKEPKFTKSEEHMTFAELRDKYITLARWKQYMAERRKQEIEVHVRRDLGLHPIYRRMTPQQFAIEVDIVTGTKCAGSKGTPGDPAWNGYVADNKWYTNYAIMYGAAAQEEAVRNLTATMESLERYLRSK